MLDPYIRMYICTVHVYMYVRTQPSICPSLLHSWFHKLKDSHTNAIYVLQVQPNILK